MGIQLRGKNGQAWMWAFEGKVQKLVGVRVRATNVLRGCESKTPKDTN